MNSHTQPKCITNNCFLVNHTTQYIYTILLLITLLISNVTASNATVADASCLVYTSCSECIHDGGLCGWCSTTNTCYSGTQYGPTTPSDCPMNSNWYGVNCPANSGSNTGSSTYDCSKLSSCSECTNAQQCGWCVSSNTCMDGTTSLTGPSSGTCDAWAPTSSECSWSAAYIPTCTTYDMITTTNLGLPVRIRVTAYPTDTVKNIQSVQLQVIQNTANPYTGNIRGVFFNVNNLQWLHDVDLGSDITFSHSRTPTVAMSRINEDDEFYTTQLDDIQYGQVDGAISLTRAVPSGNEFDIGLTVGNGTFTTTGLYINMSTLATSDTMSRPLQLSDLGLFSVVLHNVGTNSVWSNNYGVAMIATMDRCISNTDSTGNSSASQPNPNQQITNDFCNLYEHCSDCTNDFYNQCGWCATTQTCVSGSKSGPSNSTTCPSTSFMYGGNVCPTSQPLFSGSSTYTDGTCGTLQNCYECANAAACGWCSSSNTCLSGSSTQSTDNTCPTTQWTYSGQQCPVPVAYIPTCPSYYMSTETTSNTNVRVLVETTQASLDTLTVRITLDSSSSNDNIRGIFFNINNQNWLNAANLNSSIILNKLSPLPAGEIYASYTALFTSAVHNGITLTRDIPQCSGYDIGLNVGDDTTQITSIQLNITTVPAGADATLPLTLSELGLFSIRVNQLDDTTRTHSGLITQFAGCYGCTGASCSNSAALGYVSLLGEISCSTNGSRCSEYSVCGDCNDDPSCGWCGSTNQCMAGTFNGPSTTGSCSLSTWAYGYDTCSILKNQTCGGYTSCSECSLDSTCGWCSSTNTCMEGHTAPLFGAQCSGTYSTQPQTCPYQPINTPNCALYNINSYATQPNLTVQVEISDVDTVNNVLPVTFKVVNSAHSTNTGNLRAVFFDLNNPAYRLGFNSSLVTVSQITTINNTTTYTPIVIPATSEWTNTLMDAYSNTTSMTLIPAVNSHTIFDLAIQLSNLTDMYTELQLNFTVLDNLSPDQFGQFYIQANNIQSSVDTTTQVTVMDTCQRQIHDTAASAFAFITDPSIEPYFGLFWGGVSIVLIGFVIASYLGYRRTKASKVMESVEPVVAPVSEFNEADEQSVLDSVNAPVSEHSVVFDESTGDELVYVQNRVFSEITNDKSDGVQQYQIGDQSDDTARTYAAPANGLAADDVINVPNRVEEIDAASYAIQPDNKNVAEQI